MAITGEEREKDGYELTESLEAALPVPVWRVDLEIERARFVTAAESTALSLIRAGITAVPDLTAAMGLRTDTRLVERVLVRLLGAGAIDATPEGFVVTPVGEAWVTEGSTRARERVALEVRVDPFTNALEWVDHEPAAYGTDSTWTIELPTASDDGLLARKAELGELVRRGNLPDDEERAERDKRAPMDLRGFTIQARRTHWRRARIDVLRHPKNLDTVMIGFLGDAEHPGLTDLLSRCRLIQDRRRVTPR